MSGFTRYHAGPCLAPACKNPTLQGTRTSGKRFGIAGDVCLTCRARLGYRQKKGLPLAGPLPSLVRPEGDVGLLGETDDERKEIEARKAQLDDEIQPAARMLRACTATAYRAVQKQSRFAQPTVRVYRVSIEPALADY